MSPPLLNWFLCRSNVVQVFSMKFEGIYGYVKDSFVSGRLRRIHPTPFLYSSNQRTFWGDLYHLQRLTWLVERKKRTNNRTMFLTLKNNATAGYQGPVKIELLKGAGLVPFLSSHEHCRSSIITTISPFLHFILKMDTKSRTLPSRTLIGQR